MIALVRGWGNFAATSRAGLVVSDVLRRLGQPVACTFARKGRKLRLPPVQEVWPVHALQPIQGEGDNQFAEGYDKLLPFVGHPSHAGGRHHV